MLVVLFLPPRSTYICLHFAPSRRVGVTWQCLPCTYDSSQLFKSGEVRLKRRQVPGNNMDRTPSSFSSLRLQPATYPYYALLQARFAHSRNPAQLESRRPNKHESSNLTRQHQFTYFRVWRFTSISKIIRASDSDNPTAQVRFNKIKAKQTPTRLAAPSNTNAIPSTHAIGSMGPQSIHEERKQRLNIDRGPTCSDLRKYTHVHLNKFKDTVCFAWSKSPSTFYWASCTITGR